MTACTYLLKNKRIFDAANSHPFFLRAWHMGNSASYEEVDTIPEWNEEETEVAVPVRKRVTRGKTKRANARKRPGTAANRPRLRKRVEEPSYEDLQAT